MITITISPEVEESLTSLMRGLFELETRLMDMHEPLEQVKDFSKRLWDDNFLSEGATLGESWKPLAPATLADRKRKGYFDQKLVRTHRLYDRFEQLNEEGKVGMNAVEWTFTNGNDGFPVRHDQGYANPRGRARPIPARNLWGYTARDMDVIEREIAMYIEACINRFYG